MEQQRHSYAEHSSGKAGRRRAPQRRSISLRRDGKAKT
nr:MAG TPA: hypothetical protein [Caudoviricetes sp.]